MLVSKTLKLRRIISGATVARSVRQRQTGRGGALVCLTEKRNPKRLRRVHSSNPKRKDCLDTNEFGAGDDIRPGFRTAESVHQHQSPRRN